MSLLNSLPLEKIQTIVKESISCSEVLRKLQLTTNGSTNHRTLRSFLDKHKIDTLHFTLKGPKKSYNVIHELKDILVENSTYTNMTRLKIRLIRENILEYTCSICNIHEWCNQPISLQMDHINGNHTDNRLENLRLLCPSCHSQTSTYAGKNKK